MLASAFLAASCGGDDESESPDLQPSGALPSGTGLLFVVGGASDVSDGRLAVETEVVQWFTDRPIRKAGAVGIEQLVEDWESLGFEDDPPNAAVSGNENFVTVELTDPHAEEGTISFAYEAIRGSLSSGDQGVLSLFIDSAMHKDNPTSGQHKDNPTSGSPPSSN